MLLDTYAVIRDYVPISRELALANAISSPDSVASRVRKKTKVWPLPLAPAEKRRSGPCLRITCLRITLSVGWRARKVKSGRHQFGVILSEVGWVGVKRRIKRDG